MSASVKITGADELQRFLQQLPDGMFSATKTAFSRAVINAQNKITSRIQNGSPLYRRTGNLARSIQFAVEGTELKDLTASVFSASTVGGVPVVYAPIQELGGAVKAKNKYVRVPGGPYLNIPTAENKTASGVQRLSAREVFATGGKIIKSKAGKYVVLGKTQSGFAPMFVLAKSVIIPPRLGMVAAANEQVSTLIDDLDTLLQAALRNG